MGTTEPVDFVNYEALAERFRTEVKELWRKEDETKEGCKHESKHRDG